jgi:hypothetical protein
MSTNPNSITLPPIEILATVAAELSQAAREAGDKANMHALDKAMMQLHSGTAPVATTGGFLIESRTRPGLVHRVSTVHGCGCEAGRNGKACWHQSLIEIVEAAAQRYTMPALRRPVYSEALVAATELYA